MEITRRIPRNDLFRLHDHFNWLFDDFNTPVRKTGSTLAQGSLSPAVDIYERENILIIKAELPGIDKKDIHVDLKEKRLLLKAERHAETQEKDDKRKYYFRERMNGTYERSFQLPYAADPEKIKAEYTNGILRLEIPKPEEQKVRQITVH